MVRGCGVVVVECLCRGDDLEVEEGEEGWEIEEGEATRSEYEGSMSELIGQHHGCLDYVLFYNIEACLYWINPKCSFQSASCSSEAHGHFVLHALLFFRMSKSEHVKSGKLHPTPETEIKTSS